MKKIFALACVIACASTSAYAGTAGQITHMSGVLSVKKADGSSKLLSIKSEVQEGDTITTEKDTYARVKFTDGAEVVLRPNSQLKVDAYSYEPTKPAADNAFLSMIKGGLRAITGLIGKRNKDKVTVSTATATIGIRGTHFGALFCQGDCGGVRTPSGGTPADGLHVDVADGGIVLTNSAGQQLVNTGQFGFVAGPGILPIIVPAGAGITVTVPENAGGSGGSHSIGSGGQQECEI